MTDQLKILAVDDEEFNLDILTEYLTDDDYQVIGAVDGITALQQLEAHADIAVVVLDRMMPNMDGMEVLKKIKADPRFQNIPVVMQTAAATNEQILQGIQAGAYYYLPKPYSKDLLLGIVRSAATSSVDKQIMRDEVRQHKHTLGMMEQARFRFRTVAEAENLAYFIANCFPDPAVAVYGLHEILVNAVEHGNLAIAYAEKGELVLSGTWLNEIERRLALPENSNKFVTLTLDVTADRITVYVRDQGSGFNWHDYLEMSAERASDPHGRGIASAKIMSFDSIEYLGVGNEVLCTRLLAPSSTTNPSV